MEETYSLVSSSSVSPGLESVLPGNCFCIHLKAGFNAEPSNQPDQNHRQQHHVIPYGHHQCCGTFSKAQETEKAFHWNFGDLPFSQAMNIFLVHGGRWCEVRGDSRGLVQHFPSRGEM